MNYRESMDYMESIQGLGSVMGLDSIKELMTRLGNPQDELKFIHVAGTNGKGSVCAILNSILCELGYKTGVYTSPSVFAYLEKYRIGKRLLSQKAFADILTRVAKAADEMKVHPTPFEIETAVAFVAFKEAGCEVVILECGLGGKEDATNIISTPILNIFTSISLDHTRVLGKTLSDIAENKAGIMRPDVISIAGCMEGEAQDKLIFMAEKTGCPIEILDDTCRYRIKKQNLSGITATFITDSAKYEDVKLPLLGSVQAENCALAIRAAELAVSRLNTATKEPGIAAKEPDIASKELDIKSVKKGVAKVCHPGRFEIVSHNPTIIIDGAHNPDAALRLKESIETNIRKSKSQSGSKLILIMGVFADKDYEKVAEVVTPLGDMVITLHTPGNDRALPSVALAECVSMYNPMVSSASSVEEALEMALLFAEKKDIILAFGSLSYLGLLKKAIKSK